MGSGRGAGWQRENLPLLGKLAAANVLDRSDHATRAGKHLIAESNETPVRIGGGGSTAQSARQTELVGFGIERAERDEGRRGRAADAGPAVNQERRLAVP